MIKGEDVSWLPAVDVNRVIFVGQLIAVLVILSWRSVAIARARARRG